MTRRWTLLAWAFLTAGILLGAWWSYQVLGWGGFWAWDPVENASFLPWLCATAYLHSSIVQERRGLHEGLEPLARDRDLSPDDPRHFPHPLGVRRSRCTRSAIRTSGRFCSGSSGSSSRPGLGLIAWRGDGCGRREASTRHSAARARSS